MQLTTEELQYLEISLWKDYSEKITVKRNDTRIKKELVKMNKSVNQILQAKEKARMT